MDDVRRPTNEERYPPFASDEKSISEVLEGLWGFYDVEKEGSLEVSEARELMRSALGGLGFGGLLQDGTFGAIRDQFD